LWQTQGVAVEPRLSVVRGYRDKETIHWSDLHLKPAKNWGWSPWIPHFKTPNMDPPRHPHGSPMDPHEKASNPTNQLGSEAASLTANSYSMRGMRVASLRRFWSFRRTFPTIRLRWSWNLRC
jgi:hypothetical protein